MNMKTEEKIEQQIKNLSRKHTQLDEKIDSIDPIEAISDPYRESMLKKAKLAVKDRIQTLKNILKNG
jgi:hypothetical protein